MWSLELSARQSVALNQKKLRILMECRCWLFIVNVRMHTKVVSYSQVSLDKKLLPSDTLEIECLHRTRCGDCLRPIRRCFHGYFVEEVWLAFFVAGRVATEFESAQRFQRLH